MIFQSGPIKKKGVQPVHSSVTGKVFPVLRMGQEAFVKAQRRVKTNVGGGVFRISLKKKKNSEPLTVITAAIT